MSNTTIAPVVTNDIRLKIEIDAPIARVWNALTESIGDWWPAEFILSGMQASYVLEPRVGGRVFEDGGDGQGLLWGTVTTFVPNQLLQLAGDNFPGYGGPGRWFGTYELNESGGKTTLEFHYSAVGPSDASQSDSMEKGWTFLYAGCLKAHLEGRKAPAWTD